MDGLTGRAMKVLAMGVVAAAGLGLGGCRNVSKSEYDMVLAENQELRDRLSGEQGTRQELETRNASLEQENRDLASRQTAGAGTPTGGKTGFEGSGWDS